MPWHTSHSHTHILVHHLPATPPNECDAKVFADWHTDVGWSIYIVTWWIAVAVFVISSVLSTSAFPQVVQTEMVVVIICNRFVMETHADFDVSLRKNHRRNDITTSLGLFNHFHVVFLSTICHTVLWDTS